MPKFHIDEVCPKGEVYPIIVNFQNGYTTENFKTKDCLLLRNGDTGKKLIAAEIGDLIYHGSEDEEELGSTFLLARNKETGKVRLIEVSCATLKPVLKVDHDTSHLLENSNLELSRKFGSKKQKKQMEHREKLKVNVKTVKEQMQTATENMSVDKIDLSAYTNVDSDEFYVPPMDRTADKPENVYDLNTILTEDQLDQIYSELENKDYTSDMAPMIKAMIADKKVTKTQAVLAVYANCLLKLASMLAKDFQKKTFAACPHSATLNQIVTSNFLIARNGKISRPTHYKDKSLCHAIVFLLLMNNLKFDLESFCQHVKLTPTTATLKVRVTGASVVNVGSKKIVQLKLPLNTKTSFSRRKSAKF